MSIQWILDVKGLGFILNQIVIYWGKSFKLVTLLHEKYSGRKPDVKYLKSYGTIFCVLHKSYIYSTLGNTV